MRNDWDKYPFSPQLHQHTHSKDGDDIEWTIVYRVICTICMPTKRNDVFLLQIHSTQFCIQIPKSRRAEEIVQGKGKVHKHMQRAIRIIAYMYVYN